MTERKSNHDIAIELSRGNQGGFMAALGDTYCRADSRNRARLELAYPEVFDGEPVGKCALFTAALVALCRKHDVQLVTSGYAGLHIYDLKPGELPVYCAGVSDCTSEGSKV